MPQNPESNPVIERCFELKSRDFLELNNLETSSFLNWIVMSLLFFIAFKIMFKIEDNPASCTELWSSLKTHFPQMVKIDSLCCCLNIYVNIRTKNLVKNTFYSDESWNFKPKIWKKNYFYLVILHVFLYIDMFR